MFCQANLSVLFVPALVEHSRVIYCAILRDGADSCCDNKALLLGSGGIIGYVEVMTTSRLRRYMG